LPQNIAEYSGKKRKDERKNVPHKNRIKDETKKFIKASVKNALSKQKNICDERQASLKKYRKKIKERR
jgi:hypothetical protein